MTTTKDAPVMTVEHLDPGTLVIDANVRIDPRLDADFIADSADNGVEVPVDAIRAHDGQILVQDGQRRTLAAIQAQLPTIPVLVWPAAKTTRARAVRRITRQVRLTKLREGLTATEIAGAAEALFELNVPAAQVARHLHLNEGELATARKVARSNVAAVHAAEPRLTLDQAGDLADFEDDPETAARLAQTAITNPGQFTHEVQRARDRRAERFAVAQHAAKLTASGVTVTAEPQRSDNEITYWADGGKQLTPQTHAACPGNVVTLATSYFNPRKVNETWYCTDPRANGHKRFRYGGGPEQTTDQRREVLKNNKAWRSATTVRQAWLRDTLLARKTVPAGAVRFTAATFAAAEWPLVQAMTGSSGVRHKMALALLGADRPDGTEPGMNMARMVSGLSDQRATVLMLGLAVGAYEKVAGEPDGWRGHPDLTRTYLAALQAWGYPLSPLEAEVASGATPGRTGMRTSPATAPAVDTSGSGDTPGGGEPEASGLDADTPEAGEHAGASNPEGGTR